MVAEARSSGQSGYIALLTVLIVGAVAMAVAVTLLLTGVDNQRSGLAAQQSVQARALAQACAEEALQVLHDSTAYTGTGNLTLATGTCTYTVTNAAGTRTITTSGTVQTVVRKLVISATIPTSSISISSWKEIP